MCVCVQVYLEARRQEQHRHQQSLKMLSDEVSQIQEVRKHTLTHTQAHTHTLTYSTQSHTLYFSCSFALSYVTACVCVQVRYCLLVNSVCVCVQVRYCLKTLREQMAAKNKGEQKVQHVT